MNKIPWSMVKKMIADAPWYEDIEIDKRTGKPKTPVREKKTTMGDIVNMAKTLNK